MTPHPKRKYTPEEMLSIRDKCNSMASECRQHIGHDSENAAVSQLLVSASMIISQLAAQKRESDLTAVSREDIEVAIKAQKWLGEFFTPESPHYGISEATQKIFKKMLAQYSYKGTQTTSPRFFIDHGMIHDRDTGKHVTCEPDEQNLGDCNGTGEPMTLERAAADIDDCMLGGLAGPARMRRWKESIDAELAKQREAEPLVVEAVATVVKDDDGDLRLDWLLEGGICGLEDGCVLLVSDGLNEAVEEDGCTEVYTHPQQRNAVKVVDFDEIACLALEAYDNSKEMMGLCKMRDALKIAFSAVASRDREDVEAWRHSANDWADVATNGVALLENVRDGLCTANDAIALLKHDIKLVRAAQPKLSNDAARRENKL